MKKACTLKCSNSIVNNIIIVYVPMKSVKTLPSENLPAGFPGKVMPYGCFHEPGLLFGVLPVSTYESPKTNNSFEG